MVLASSLAATVGAQESVPATPIVPATTVETKVADQAQLEASMKGFDKKANDYMKKFRAEKDRAKQREMYNQRPKPEAVIDMVLSAAKADPKAAGVEQGLSWCVDKAQGAQRKEVKNLLLTHYADSEAIGKLAYSYLRMWSGGEKELRQIIEKAGSEKVRQSATYYLAEKLCKKEETKAKGITLLKKLQDWPKIAETAPKLLAQVKSKVFVIEKLSIGCVAPDIEGTDQDDKSFKLSDYRGQVVLLDFWGMW